MYTRCKDCQWLQCKRGVTVASYVVVLLFIICWWWCCLADVVCCGGAATVLLLCHCVIYGCVVTVLCCGCVWQRCNGDVHIVAASVLVVVL